MHKDRLKIFGCGNWVKCLDFCEDMEKLQQKYPELQITDIINRIRNRGVKNILMNEIIEIFKYNNIPVSIVEENGGISYVVDVQLKKENK